MQWKCLLLAGIGVYYLQLLVFRNCILTALQFGEKDRDTTFYSYYLDKLGFSVNKRRLRYFLDFVLPWLLFFLAVWLQ